MEHRYIPSYIYSSRRRAGRSCEMEEFFMRKKEENRLRQKCFALGKALVASERSFSFSLKIGEVFAMLLVGSDCKTKAKSRRRTPSNCRRQERRWAAFLEKKNTPVVDLGGIAETTVKKQDKGRRLSRSLKSISFRRHRR